MMIFCANAVLDFVNKVNDKLHGYLAVILAAAVLLLLIILLMVAHSKNKKIRALKKELKSTRKELDETQAQLEQERAEKAAAEQETAEKEQETSPEPQPAPDPEPTPAPARKPAPKAEPTVTLTPAAEAYASTRPDDTEEEIVSPEPASGSSKASDKDAVKYVVKYDRLKDSWIIQRSGSERVVRRLRTKEEAMSEARAMCKRQNATLVVHKKDGKFQKQ